MHVSPAKHSSAWLPRKCDYQTDTLTDRQTDRQMPDKVIPMCRFASQATQKLWLKSLHIQKIHSSVCPFKVSLLISHHLTIPMLLNKGNYSAWAKLLSPDSGEQYESALKHLHDIGSNWWTRNRQRQYRQIAKKFPKFKRKVYQMWKIDRWTDGLTNIINL